MDLNRRAELAAKAGLKPAIRMGVITVHGWMTPGAWQKDIDPALHQAHIDMRHVSYGVRIVPRTSDVVVRILEKVELLRLDGVMRFGAIAHSLGSLALGNALQQNPTLRFHRVIVTGSILPRDYDWGAISRRQQVLEVMSERCPKDRWARVAPLAFWPWGGGDSGCHGFTSPSGVVRDVCYNATTHSSLLTERHCRDAWIPFLNTGRIPVA